MDQRLDQHKAGSSADDRSTEKSIVASEAKGFTVTLPFTMQDLTEEYMALSTADERENFWKELELRMKPFTDEQKALFALSCTQSLEEISKSVKQTADRIDKLTAVEHS